MVPSTLHGESRVDRVTYPYTLIPIYQDNDDEKSCDCEEFFGTPWRVVRTTLGLVALLILCLMIPYIIKNRLFPNSHITPPRFFLHSLRVSSFNISEGELSASWNVKLTISNGENSTFVNFINFKALIVYKEDKALALSFPPINSEKFEATRGIFIMDKNENKTLHLTFNTTGWEKDQPIVDDDVIQKIGEEMKSGVMKFGLKIEVEVEFELNLTNVPMVMHPYCSNLEVDLAPLQRGEVSTFDNVGKVKECLDP